MKKLKLKNLVAVALMAMTIVTVSPVTASAAWKQDSNGWWNTEGNSYSIGWRNINGSWYYFDSIGYMKTGWVNDNGVWYYMQPSGAMKTGWVNDNNAWYHLAPSGSMETGLVQVDNKTYYLNQFGAMQTGNITVNGQNYSFAASGEKVNATNTTETKNSTSETANSNTDSAVTGGGSSSGGSSHSGGGSTSDNDSSKNSYQTLYGNWTVERHIPSNMNSKLSNDMIGFCIGQSFNIEKDKITSDYKNIYDPKVTEKTMTNSEFQDKYHDTFKNVGISGDKVKDIKIYSKANNKSVNLLVSDDGHVYSIAGNTLFELEKN